MPQYMHRLSTLLNIQQQRIQATHVTQALVQQVTKMVVRIREITQITNLKYGSPLYVGDIKLTCRFVHA
jgi:hypothetical protein